MKKVLTSRSSGRLPAAAYLSSLAALHRTRTSYGICEMRNVGQQSLFDDQNSESFSIEDSAKILGVSGATIRNWIKTGYLKVVSKGQVSKDSVENFKSNISGLEKLNQRANKSKKDTHNHEYVAAEFLEKAKSESDTLKSIGDRYESSLSDSSSTKEGISYTPSYIVNDLLS